MREQLVTLSVAEAVQAEMTRQRISGRTLALELGKSHTYLARRIRGEVSFSVDDLTEIASALHVAPESFLARAAS